MTKQRDKERASRNAEWTEGSVEGVTAARFNIGLGPNDYIPDEALLAEAAHYLPRSNSTGSRHHRIQSHEQWAGFRLIGVADTAEGRSTLAKKLSQAYSYDPKLSPSNGKSRRSAPAGRRRNLKSV